MEVASGGAGGGAARGGGAEKFLNETESNLEFTLSDGTNAYTFSLPRVKYNSGQPDVSGEGEVTVSMGFQALFNATEESQIVIMRGAA